MKKRNLMIVGLMSILAMTACSNGGDEPGTDDPGQQEQQEVKVTGISLDQTSITLEEEQSVSLRATIAPENATNKRYTWASDNEDVAIVNGLGKVRALTAGDAHITVTSEENSQISATCTVHVTAKDRTVHVSSVQIKHATEDLANGLSLNKGESDVLIAEVNPSNATNRNVTWSSSHEEVASISATGAVRALAGGTTTITLASVDDPTKTDTLELTVVDTEIKVHSVVITSEDTHFTNTDGVYALTLQDVDRPTAQLVATAKAEDPTKTPTETRILWSVSEHEDVVSVSTNGTVSAKQAGTAKVRATSLADSTKYAEVNVTVEQESEKDLTVHVDSIEWAHTPATSINLGEEEIYTASLLPANTGYPQIDYEFIPGTTGATVEVIANGVYKVRAGQVAGQVTLKVKAHDLTNKDVAGKGPFELVQVINIVDPITHVTGIDLGTLASGTTLYVDDQIVLGDHVTVSPNNATDPSLRYVSDDEEVALISNGKVIARKAGTATITVASVQDTAVTESFVVTVKNIPINRVVVSEEEATLEINDTLQLSATVYMKHPDKAEAQTVATVVWSSLNTNIATVNPETGVVTARATGDATIRATVSGANPGEAEVYDSCTIHVVDTKPIILRLDKSDAYLSYELATDENRLTSIANLDTNSAANKGYFFEDTKTNLLYKVGDQGLFKFAPLAKARFNNGTEDYYAGVKLHRELELYNGADFDTDTQIDDHFTSEGVSGYAVISQSGIDFDATAVGKIFRMTISVEDDSAYTKNNTLNDTTIMFKVVEGYNAYTLADLSLYDNHTVSKSPDKTVNWSEYYASLPESERPSQTSATGGIVMHNTIKVTQDDFFKYEQNGTVKTSRLSTPITWTKDEVDNLIANESRINFAAWKELMGFKDEESAKEALYDSPKDWVTLFERQTRNIANDNFTIHGNFFSVNLKDFKQIAFLIPHDGEYEFDLVAGQNGDGSHGQVFGINSQDRDNITAPLNDHITFENFQFNNNGGIAAAEDATAVRRAKGGFIGIKMGRAEFNARNFINSGSFTGFHTEKEDEDASVSVMNLDRVKAYDSYNSMLYIWGTKNNNVTNSWFTGAGGPLVLMDECNAGPDDAHASLNQTVCECTNVYLNNPVSGTEPWFAQHNAASMVQDYLVNAGAVSYERDGDGNITGLDTDNSGWIGRMAAGCYNSALASGKTITTKVESTSLETIKMVNFIAIDVWAHHFADNVYAPLSGQFIVHNSEEAIMDLSNVDKTGRSYNDGVFTGRDTSLVPGKFCPIIAECSNGGVGYVFLDQAQSYGMNASFKNTDAWNTYVSAAAPQFASGLTLGQAGVAPGGNYISYFLDPVISIANATTMGNQTAFAGYYVGAFLGTYAFAPTWLS